MEKGPFTLKVNGPFLWTKNSSGAIRISFHLGSNNKPATLHLDYIIIKI
jgi:hypothetical protein